MIVRRFVCQPCFSVSRTSVENPATRYPRSSTQLNDARNLRSILFLLLSLAAWNVNATNNASKAGVAAGDEHSLAADSITIHEKSGHAQTNRAVTIPRAFRQGEIVHFAEASIEGKRVLTQCDVKNRWPDGSLKYAIVSFIVPTLNGHGSGVISFLDQSDGHNTDYLTPDGLLDARFDFDATIEMAGPTTQKVSARDMLAK